MPLNLYAQLAPCSPHYHYQTTNLHTRQNSLGEVEEFYMPQQPNLQASNSPNSFVLCQPFFFSEQEENEEHSAALPPFEKITKNSAPQLSIQTNNYISTSYFSEKNEAISHLFPNQFTSSLPASIDPNLTQKNIDYAYFPVAEEGNNTSSGQPFSAMDSALPFASNSANGAASNPFFSAPQYSNEAHFSPCPPIHNTEQFATYPAIISRPPSPLKVEWSYAQPLRQTNELSFEEASQDFYTRAASSDDAMLSLARIDKKKIKTENEDNLIKNILKPRKNTAARAAQNRIAQTKYRNKRKMYIRSLEEKNIKLEEKVIKLEEGRRKLQEKIDKLQPSLSLEILEMLRQSNLIE